MKDKYYVMDLMEQDLSLSIYEREGFDFKVAAVCGDKKVCNLFHLEDGRYEFVASFSNHDGSDITKKDILSNVALLFDNE